MVVPNMLQLYHLRVLAPSASQRAQSLGGLNPLGQFRLFLLTFYFVRVEWATGILIEGKQTELGRHTASVCFPFGTLPHWC